MLDAKIVITPIIENIRENAVRPKRKAIPVAVKCEVVRRQRAHCQECKKPLWPSDPTEYDHRPSLILRPINPDGTDYLPPQNDPDHIEALHASCHQQRTTGRRPGASRTITTKGSDVGLKTKFARLERKKDRKPRATITPKGFGKIPARKNPWPKRTFRKP